MAETGQPTQSRDDSSYVQPMLPLSTEERLHAVCDEFENAWKSAQNTDSPPPHIESYLSGHVGRQREWLLFELIQLELNYRPDGDTELRELEQRFPESHALIRSAFASTRAPQTAILRTSTEDTAVDVETGAGRHRFFCEQCGRSVYADEPEPNAFKCPQCASLFSIEKIGRYQLLSKLGDGGFGRVYKAYDPNVDECVAIKIPRNWEAWSPDIQKRFRREAQIAFKLSQGDELPHIVRVLNVEDDDRRVPYIVSQFIDGRTLKDVIDRAEEPDCRMAAEWTRQIAEALEYAHATIIHRDVKPGNILLNSSSQAKLTDFGLARPADRDTISKTVDGHLLGTLPYMSPEQAEGRQSEIDRRSDVYSLGVVLYELLTSQTPFEGASGADLLRQIRVENPKPPRELNPAISRDLETICLTCLKKDREERYQSASALASDLQAYLNGDPIRPPRFSPVSRAWRWCKSNRLVSSLAAMLSLLLIAIAVVVSGLRKLDQAKAQAGDDTKLKVIGGINNTLDKRGASEPERIRPVIEIEGAPPITDAEPQPLDSLFEEHREFLVDCLQFRVEVLDDFDVSAARYLGVTGTTERELRNHQSQIHKGAAQVLWRFGHLANQPQIIDALRTISETTHDSDVRAAVEKTLKRIQSDSEKVE